MYTPECKAYYGGDENNIPVVLAGNSNIKYASVDSAPLRNLLHIEFDLHTNNDPAIPTTRSDTRQSIQYFHDI